MKKVIKRALLVLLILFVVLIATLIIVPIAFKPQLKRLAEKEINSSLNAKVDFKDFQVSLIKGFPNLYVGLKGLTIVGIGDFEKDTLVAFDEFSVKVDLMSALGMKNIEVKSVLLNNPKLTARIAPTGKVNWDVMKSDTGVVEKPVVASSEPPTAIKVALRKFEIRNATIKYIDDSSNMKAIIKDLDFVLSGNMGMDKTELKITSSVNALTFEMDGLKYLNKVRLGFKGDIEADMVKSEYTFKENECSLNAIVMNFAGVVKMPKDDIDVDIKFSSNKTDFKSILSLVPAIYMQGYEDLQTSGKVNLGGYVKGIYNDKLMPNANIELVVENAMFKYPSLPKSANNINVDTKIVFDGTNMDNTTVDVNRFYIELAGNPFDAQMHISTPMSDMQVSGAINGKLDFTSIADVIPLDSMKIKGLLESNIQFGGKMSYIDKQQYEKFKADGTMKLTNFEFISPDLPQGFKIVESTMNFSPKYVDLASFDSKIGKSDLKMTGRLENFVPYVFNNQTIRGNLNITSNILDANEFLSGGETPTDSVPLDSSAMSVIEIPKNVDFSMKATVNHIYYDKMDISSVNGNLLVKDGKVNMDNISMKMLDGSLLMSGEYNTQNVKKPTVAFSINASGFDIPTTIKSFSMLSKIASSAKEVKGKVSTQFTMTATLDTALSPIYSTINAKGKLQSNEIGFTNSKVFGQVADFLKNDALRNPVMKDVNISFTAKDGRIYIDPFNTKIADFKMNIGGDMGFDQSLNFKAKISIPRSTLGPVNNAVDDILALISSKGVNVKLSDVINLNVKIGGTATKPEVRPEWGGSVNDESSTTSSKESTKDVVKDEVKKKTKEELIAEAEKEAERLNAEALTLAEKVRKESKDNADKLESEGNKKGGFAAQAAKVAASKLRKEGENAAQRIIRDADAKGKALIEKAKQDNPNP